MSESTFPADLLSSLAANPDLLKNAMQMASALASSGMLDGILGKGNESTPSPSAPDSETDFSAFFSEQGSKKNPEPPPTPHSPTEPSQPRDPRPTVKRSTPPCHNDRIQLLRSVRPFLPEDKREKIDFLVQLLGLIHTAEELGLRKLF